MSAAKIYLASTRAEPTVAALDLARSLGWAKTSDAEYVVLAQRRACPLLTTDARLERRAQHLVDIRRPRSVVE